MSRNGRTRIFKWDTKEECQGDALHGIRHQKPGESTCYNESQTWKHPPQLASVFDSERNGVESRNKSDIEFPDVALSWNRTGSYSTKMSPGLEDWRQQYHSHSPRTGFGRSFGSRSRSPPGGFNRESGLCGRNNAAQTCRDFAAGRCGSGDHCPRLHQGDREYEDRRCWKTRDRMDDRREYLQSMGKSNDLCSDFIKGKCYKGKPCRFAHNIQNRSLGHPPNNSGAVDSDDGEYLRPNNKTTAGSGGFESNGAESWFADMEVCSPWNPGQSSSNYPVSSTFPGGQNQHTLPLYGCRGEITISAQKRPFFQDGETLGTRDAVNGNKSGLPTEILPTLNILSMEQLSQFANLSALHQLLGNAHQLCISGSVPNPPKAITFMSPNSVPESVRQYDPLIDSIESVQCHNDSPPVGGLPPSPSEGKVTLGNQQEVPSKDILSSPTVHGNNGTTVEESKKAKENGSLENVNGDGRVDERKKKSNEKAIRAFKFALAEFVKEILKPKWKGGEINRETYKTIVKKVVDKVTESVQGAHIPQSQEKIDNYLLSSKLKVTKLVEAYVEKQQKTKT